jgi:hypothetical protein
LLDNFPDTLLTLQVKCTGGCSDKALSLNQQWFSPGTLNTGGNGWTLHSITFTNNNNLFPFKFHLYILQALQIIAHCYLNLLPLQ